MSDRILGEAAQVSPGVLAARLGMGLVQALALVLLVGATDAPLSWPATHPAAFEPMFLVAILVPLIVILGLGRIGLRPLLIWTLVVVIVVAGLAHHDATRGRVEAFAAAQNFWPWYRLWLALPVSLFVAHVLVVDQVTERRLMPSYPRHFDTAWKLAVQIILGLVFVAVLFGVLYLGAGLFIVGFICRWKPPASRSPSISPMCSRG